MADYKTQLVQDVSTALVNKIDADDIGTVSDEMLIALRDYEVTKRVTDLTVYDGYNEDIQKSHPLDLAPVK